MTLRTRRSLAVVLLLSILPVAVWLGSSSEPDALSSDPDRRVAESAGPRSYEPSAISGAPTHEPGGSRTPADSESAVETGRLSIEAEADPGSVQIEAVRITLLPVIAGGFDWSGHGPEQAREAVAKHDPKPDVLDDQGEWKGSAWTHEVAVGESMTFTGLAPGNYLVLAENAPFFDFGKRLSPLSAAGYGRSQQGISPTAINRVSSLMKALPKCSGYVPVESGNETVLRVVALGACRISGSFATVPGSTFHGHVHRSRDQFISQELDLEGEQAFDLRDLDPTFTYMVTGHELDGGVVRFFSHTFRCEPGQHLDAGIIRPLANAQPIRIQFTSESRPDTLQAVMGDTLRVGLKVVSGSPFWSGRVDLDWRPTTTLMLPDADGVFLDSVRGSGRWSDVLIRGSARSAPPGTRVFDLSFQR